MKKKVGLLFLYAYLMCSHVVAFRILYGWMAGWQLLLL